MCFTSTPRRLSAGFSAQLQSKFKRKREFAYEEVQPFRSRRSDRRHAEHDRRCGLCRQPQGSRSGKGEGHRQGKGKERDQGKAKEYVKEKAEEYIENRKAKKEAEKQAALEEEKRKEEEAKAAEEAKKAVYISKAGKKYHTKDCRYTGKSSKKVTRAEAIEMGKKPCNTCHPDGK